MFKLLQIIIYASWYSSMLCNEKYLTSNLQIQKQRKTIIFSSLKDSNGYCSHLIIGIHSTRTHCEWFSIHGKCANLFLLNRIAHFIEPIKSKCYEIRTISLTKSKMCLIKSRVTVLQQFLNRIAASMKIFELHDFTTGLQKRRPFNVTFHSMLKMTVA